MSKKYSTARIARILDIIIILIGYYVAIMSLISNESFQAFISSQLSLLWYFLIFRKREKVAKEKETNKPKNSTS
jgi:hypothetical protein